MYLYSIILANDEGVIKEKIHTFFMMPPLIENGCMCYIVQA